MALHDYVVMPMTDEVTVMAPCYHFHLQFEEYAEKNISQLIQPLSALFST